MVLFDTSFEKQYYIGVWYIIVWYINDSYVNISICTGYYISKVEIISVCLYIIINIYINILFWYINSWYIVIYIFVIYISIWFGLWKITIESTVNLSWACLKRLRWSTQLWVNWPTRWWTLLWVKWIPRRWIRLYLRFRFLWTIWRNQRNSMVWISKDGNERC